MLETLTLLTALSCGQVLGPPQAAPETPRPQAVFKSPRLLFTAGQKQPAAPAAEEKKAEEPAEEPAAAPNITKAAEEEEEEEEASAPEDRWFLMRALQGTFPGYLLNDNKIKIWGWSTMSYTPSTADVDNNLPVTWNDRSNQFLINQNWLRIERPVSTDGTTPSWGFRVDLLYGTDYRWLLPRGLWNSQLLNNDGNINLYGIDSPAHYLEFQVPTVFQGLNVKVGRILTPFGVESVETISSPLVSKSYSFNWFPPFTHFGALATATLNPTWTVSAGLVNGNDVYIGDPSEEWRFLGTIKYTSPNARDVITFGTSLGRGKFDASDPFNPPTYGLMTEPAGRNNINVFDIVWNHVINPRVSYTLELDYGYQTNVPANVLGGIIDQGRTEGTAHWGGMVHYLTVNWTPKVTGVTRLELWDDLEGQRTGFEGLYTALTLGLSYKPMPWLMLRQEVRYDYNDYSTPFNNGTRHELLTAGMDLTVRW